MKNLLAFALAAVAGAPAAAEWDPVAARPGRSLPPQRDLQSLPSTSWPKQRTWQEKPRMRFTPADRAAQERAHQKRMRRRARNRKHRSNL